jgi:iron(III) transport system ATP-binding protein
VVEPDILLLDEPLSNLDAKLRERMRSELKELQRRTGITFVYVTHDQAEALALSDQIAVMSAGRLEQYGTPFEVYAHPANRMIADFMGLVNLVPGTVRRGEDGGRSVEISPAFALEFAALDGLAPGDGVDVAIRPENIRLAPPLRAEPSKMAKITNHVFLGKISEYYVSLPSGQTLRVQTHPLQLFAVGDTVAVEVDAKQCSVFRQGAGARPPVHVGEICRRPVGPRRPHPVRARLVDGVAADLRSARAGTQRLVRHGVVRGARLRLLVRGYGGLRPLDQGPRQ